MSDEPDFDKPIPLWQKILILPLVWAAGLYVIIGIAASLDWGEEGKALLEGVLAILVVGVHIGLGAGLFATKGQDWRLTVGCLVGVLAFWGLIGWRAGWWWF